MEEDLASPQSLPGGISYDCDCIPTVHDIGNITGEDDKMVGAGRRGSFQIQITVLALIGIRI
jgi:hypothetical protein